MTGRRYFPFVAIATLIFLVPVGDAIAQASAGQEVAAYRVQPGDRVQIYVWNEPELQKELLVAPDGGIAFPLVGELQVTGKSTTEIRQEIAQRLAQYIAEPLVTVTIDEVLGNKIYVIGQVQEPGQFVVNPMVNVMQALSMAGGTTPFASLNNIVILRREGDRQIAIPFRYGDVSSGKNLELNIILKSGDVVIVP